MLETSTRTVGEMTQQEVEEMYEACMSQLDAEAPTEDEVWPEMALAKEEQETYERERAIKLRSMANMLRRVADEFDGLADLAGGKPVPADAPQPMPYVLR